MNHVFVANVGSSSLKYQLINMETEECLVSGNCERIGIEGSKLTHKAKGKEVEIQQPMPNHNVAVQLVLKELTDKEAGVISSMDEIDAVGHRIAHGGERYKQSTVIDDEVIRYLQSIVPINPLHGPPAIIGMEACRRLMKDTLQVGVFDTAFYAEMEDFRYIYPLPYELYAEKKIRRYGFHGTSHRYVSAKAAEMLDKDPKELKIVTCHLGNGSSITAVDGGKAVDTSMGFTPQEGILMGTRSGSIDPTIIPYLMKTEGMNADEVEDLLNRRSGLLGVSGVSNDARNVTEAAANGNDRARLALDILVHGIKKYIGGYIAVMNGIDALVFTAGIGENDDSLRSRICRNMDTFGIAIDEELNAQLPKGREVDISASGARVKTLVIPTNEEYMIAMDTARLATK